MCHSVSEGSSLLSVIQNVLVDFSEGFRCVEVAVNNTHLSQRATWKCSWSTSSFSASAGYNALRDLGGLNLRRLRHWRDPALALALSRSVALGPPQFDSPYVCTIFSHVSSVRIFLPQSPTSLDSILLLLHDM